MFIINEALLSKSVIHEIKQMHGAKAIVGFTKMKCLHGTELHEGKLILIKQKHY